MNWGIASKPRINTYLSCEKKSRKIRKFRLREEGILETALRLFCKEGEKKITVEMISASIGIGKGTIYKHFRSKLDIYMRLLLDYETSLHNVLTKQDFMEHELVWNNYLVFCMNKPEQTALFSRLENKLLKYPHSMNMDSIYQIRSQNVVLLKSLIHKRMNSGNLEQAPVYFHIYTLYAMINGIASLYESSDFDIFIKDRKRFTRFLIEIGRRLFKAQTSNSKLE